jgi:hypothetical protein
MPVVHVVASFQVIKMSLNAAQKVRYGTACVKCFILIYFCYGIRVMCYFYTLGPTI